MAVDERIKAAAPVNMISATSQGGVLRERLPTCVRRWTDFSNMVVGALMAPRPLLLVSASGDWTAATPTEVFPAIQSIYRLLGVENNVENDSHRLHRTTTTRTAARPSTSSSTRRLLNNTAPVPEQAFRVEFPTIFWRSSRASGRRMRSRPRRARRTFTFARPVQ